MVEIRKLKDEDKPQVRTLELFCVREYLEGSLRKNWDDLPAELVEQLGASAKDSFEFYRDGGMSYVAVEQGQVIGFLFAQIIRYVNNIEKVLWIENIGVHPEHRRKGVGLKLLRRAALDAKKKGAKAVQSVIMPDSKEAVMLHKKVGFFMDGRKFAFLDLENFQ
ncbi:MAG TPA: GNAT family N-acetyltransferase [Methanomassiliicoccales archaeon]|jgi:aminoglycoside 6'-N-acetyltransferase I|nr:GNAT family N-acetyltransferase [Euryarchaeota archaeon]HOE52153.1 GNAT family N-acetyltransferase [Methanomassiliicoccales archaeon]HOO03739.1 GNAT family N-acetyltransferase [Methanomassiliicoccales archaeon]HQM67104.1 GNAT family N-acetyltransferase [Methanomassiliicoccales archaeon]HRR67050.1 GNAT family N-acetyltransferase [Methanomassiliicoccales archaeon]